MGVKLKKCYRCKNHKKFLPKEFFKFNELWHCLPCALKYHPDELKEQLQPKEKK